jgi:hypothetical protein
VLEYGISVIAGLGERRVFACPQQNRVGPVDTHKPQLTQRVCNRIRIIPHIRRQRFDGIAGAFPDTPDIRVRVSVEDGPVFGKGQLLCRIFRELPVGVIGTALHIVDLPAR